VLRITTFSGGKKEMAFEYKRQFPKGETSNGNGSETNGCRTHRSETNGRDFGREQAEERWETQSIKSLRLRQHFDCEPPWDILRASVSYTSPDMPHEPLPDRFDVWPADMAGYWPCPICDTPLVAVDRTPMKLFRCLTCDTETVVHVKAPVVDCPRHGRREIDLPWGRNDVKWTYLGTEPGEAEPQTR
jgi:hypothetical protein